MRKQLLRSWTTATSASQLELHFFPYDTLPIIHSHIRPHFVVYNLGMKLSTLNWLQLLFFDDQYQLLTNKHPTLFACIQRSMDLYKEWTREQPPSNFGNTYSSGDQSGGADISNANNARLAYGRKPSNKSGQGDRSTGKSGGGDARGSGTVDDEDEIYPDDSLTLVFEAAAEQDDANEPPNDEHTDDESDESFYERLDTWVTSVRPGPPPPPSPATVHSHAGSKTISERDTDSEDGSTTFVGVIDCKTGGMEVSVTLGEKVGILSSFSFLNPGTV